MALARTSTPSSDVGFMITRESARLVDLHPCHTGLRVWAVPTEQGYYEPDVSELVRAKAYQQFGFGTYPTAVVFDKIDVVGSTRHPLYSYLASFPDPNGVGRLSLNFEKREYLSGH